MRDRREDHVNVGAVVKDLGQAAYECFRDANNGFLGRDASLNECQYSQYIYNSYACFFLFLKNARVCLCLSLSLECPGAQKRLVMLFVIRAQCFDRELSKCSRGDRREKER